MNSKVRVWGGMVALAVICNVFASGAFQTPAKDPDLVNQNPAQGKKQAFWVHRREPGKANTSVRPNRDEDDSGAILVAIQMRKNMNDLEAKIWRYTDYDFTNSQFKNRQPVIEAKCEPKGLAKGNSMENTREREQYELKEIINGQPTATTVGYVTFYKGMPKGKGNGKGTANAKRKATRAIFRWDSMYVQKFIPDPDRKPSKLHNCDEPPDDDPMEEEDLPLDNTEPPDPLDDPV